MARITTRSRRIAYAVLVDGLVVALSVIVPVEALTALIGSLGAVLVSVFTLWPCLAAGLTWMGVHAWKIARAQRRRWLVVPMWITSGTVAIMILGFWLSFTARMLAHYPSYARDLATASGPERDFHTWNWTSPDDLLFIPERALIYDRTDTIARLVRTDPPPVNDNGWWRACQGTATHLLGHFYTCSTDDMHPNVSFQLLHPEQGKDPGGPWGG